MKWMSWTCACALSGSLLLSSTWAGGLRQPLSVQPAAFDYRYFAQDDVASPSDQPAGADESAAPVQPTPAVGSGQTDSACGGCAASAPCGGCGACDACCGYGCDGGLLGLGLGQRLLCCDLGDPWTINDLLLGPGSSINVSGLAAFGWHDESNDLFNRNPNNFNTDQISVFVQKEAKAPDVGWDWGFGFEAFYGVDGPFGQSFGNDPGEWDFVNGFDHGIYAWALPQLYGSVAFGDWTVQLGHFYTPVGLEAVRASANFFYSHSITHFLSEPFSHTGVMGTYTVSDNLTAYSGWALGWDSGFAQSNQGNIAIGGFKASITDDISVTYLNTIGNFGWRGDDADSHHMFAEFSLTDKLTYILYSDILRVDETGEDNFSLVHYLYYWRNDCLGFGSRVEWWKGDSLTGYAPHGGVLPATGTHSYYEATFGMNIKPTANLVFRPEYRVDWSPAVNYDETYGAFDVILTY